MSQTDSLSKIIRAVTEHAKYNDQNQKLITIDARSGQALESPGFLDTLTGNLRYFLVSNTRNHENFISGTKQVKYKESQGEVVFAIKYKAGCAPGQEWWLAQCFFKSPATEEKVRDALARWLIEYFSANGRPIDRFQAERTKIGAELATRARQEFGLDLAAELEIEIPDSLQLIQIGPIVVSSRLRNLDEEKAVWLKAELEVDPNLLIRALLHEKAPFTDLAVKGVRTYLAESVTLETLYHDLNSAQLRRQLSAGLDNLLQPYGRYVKFVSLKCDEDPPTPLKWRTEIKFRHHEYPEPIIISISIRMAPANAAQYHSNGSPKLETWLEANLTEVIDEVLFGVPYVDLLLEFQSLKKRIDELMQARATRIGYSIEQLMTILHLEPFEWLKRIDIEIKAEQTNGDSAAEMFETSVSGFYVGLEIFLIARIKDLRGIARYLTANQNVPTRMKEEIVRLVRTTIHATNPARFYLQYSALETLEPSSSKSFEEELREKINRLVASEFNGEILELVLKPLSTDFTQKLGLVSTRSHDFAATAQLGTRVGAPEICVQGSFRVQHVSADGDGWRTFKNSEISVETITKCIQLCIQARLKSAPDTDSLFAQQDGLDEFIKQALFSAIKLISQEFGLAAKFTSVSWEWSGQLKQLALEQSKDEILAVQERISRLKEKRLDLIENDADLEEVREIEQRIDRLSASLSLSIASTLGNATKALPADSSPTTRSTTT